MAEQIQVQVGQRYCQHFKYGSYQQIWEVASISRDGVRIPHARLVNVENPTESKTLSYLALSGQYSFTLLNGQ